MHKKSTNPTLITNSINYEAKKEPRYFRISFPGLNTDIIVP